MSLMKIIKNIFNNEFVVDTHNHTKIRKGKYVSDGKFTVDQLTSLAKKKGIDCVIITDHNILNPCNNKIVNGVLVISGIEVLTDNGEIQTIGVNDSVVEMRNLKKIIEYTHKNNGIIIMPHPFTGNKSIGKNNSPAELERIASLCDAIEINGQASEIEKSKTISLAKKVKKPLVGGSDTHDSKTSALCVTIFKDKIKSQCDFIKKIKSKQYTYRILKTI